MDETQTMAEADADEQCAYCGAWLGRDWVEEPVPAVGDDDGWARAADRHRAGCEWVTTRAHRVFGPEAGADDA